MFISLWLVIVILLCIPGVAETLVSLMLLGTLFLGIAILIALPIGGILFLLHK